MAFNIAEEAVASVSKPRLNFASLPPELRYLIYGLLLILDEKESADPNKIPLISEVFPSTPWSHLAGLQLISRDGHPTTAQIAIEATQFFFSQNKVMLGDVESPRTLTCNSNIKFDLIPHVRRAEMRQLSRRRGVYLSQWGLASPAEKFEPTFRMLHLRELRLVSVFAPADCLYEDQADQTEIRALIFKLEARGVKVIKDYEAIPAP